MDTSKLQTTAEDFWEAFENFSESSQSLQCFSKETDKTRFLCLLGLTSLDAQANIFWKSQIVPEWNELVSLMKATLSDEKNIFQILQFCGTHLTRSQVVASISFLTDITNPENFHPTLLDCGIIWLFMRNTESYNSDFEKVSKMLIQLNLLRASCLQMSNTFNELKGREIIILLNRLRDIAPAFSPAFLGNGFSVKSNQLKAA